MLSIQRRGPMQTLGGTGSRILLAMLAGPFVGMATGKRSNLLLWWKPFQAEVVANLLALIADGKVTPRIDRRLPLSQVVEALHVVNDGRPSGKVVITV